MMLLTAFVLVIAFVALSGMVSRVTQLPEETRQLAERPIFREADAVIAATAHAMERVEADFVVDEDADFDHYRDEVDKVMQHLVQLEASRGFRLSMPDPNARWTSCTPGTNVVEIDLVLTSAETRFSATVSRTVGDLVAMCP